MNDEGNRKAEVLADAEPIDLDSNTSEDLDAAMRDALEAVESGGEKSPSRVEAPREEPGGDSVPISEIELGETEDDLRAAVAAHRERALRTLADFENYRKRVQREREDEFRFRAFEPMRDFLAVVDNLERAIASAGDVDDLKQGVEMILKQMENLLRDNQVVRIDALGQPFDPSLHEAVSRHEEPSVSEPTVSEQLQAGYMMLDRLIRPAVVKVAMPLSSGGGGDVNE